MLETILSTQPQDYKVMYIDMDSFFASVEQQREPTLRGRPVCVCPYATESSSVVAASYEAKRMGVRVGMKVYQARQLCPDLVYVSDSPADYRRVHAQIMTILDATVCHVVPKSIDEAYGIIPSYMRTQAEVFALAKGIKDTIRQVLGEHIKCSIGIAPNIWLAKMAASHDKPNGLVILHKDALVEFLTPLRLVDCTGIAWRLARQLYRLGIYSVADLYKSDYTLLRQKLGINGVKWHLRLRGYEVDHHMIRPKQSISHQVTLVPQPALQLGEILRLCLKISSRIGQRLRSMNRRAQIIVVSVRFVNHTSWARASRLTEALCSDQAIYEIVAQMLSRMRFQPVRRVAIYADHLVDDVQLGWGLDTVSDKQDALSRALDDIQTRWGKHMLVPARLLGKPEIMPDRIGFGQLQ